MKKGFEGEKNVLQTRIDALEKQVKIQERQINELAEQLNNAYGKVQDIAIRAIAVRESKEKEERHERPYQPDKIVKVEETAK